MAALERLIKVLASLLAQADTMPEIALVPALASCIPTFTQVMSTSANELSLLQMEASLKALSGMNNFYAR